MKAEDRYSSLFQYYVEYERERQAENAATWPANLWLLVKEQCRAESNFNPNAVSDQGAVGLMQLMPDTALEMGIRDRKNPEHSIRGGVEYLVRHCWRVFKLERGLERWRFALGAYNAGVGHIVRAQELAVDRGLDPARWVSIVQTLPRITGPENAEQTTNYVAKIMRRYEEYA